jgi:hypothetical protein
LIIKINGVEISDGTDIHDLIKESSYGSIGEMIKGNISEAIQNTEWYRENSDFNIFSNYEGVRGLCDDNTICWMDAVNRSFMESNEFTGSVYKFIQHRAGLIREGFTENLLGDNLEAVLDCILWFI